MLSNITTRFPLQARAVSNARNSGRMAHAFLITGDREDNRLAFAQFLARAIACSAPQAHGPCEACRTCRMLANGNYPELIELYPVGKTREIKLGDPSRPEPNTLRDFVARLNLTSFEGIKIGMIHDADRLAKSENALLKTLEEPPDNVAIILISGNPLRLLPTTRSRCWQLSLTENRIDYDYPGADTVFAALCDLAMNPNRGLKLGMDVAETIIAVAKELEAAAKSEVEKLWEDRFTQAAELDPSLVKNMRARCDSEAYGQYMKSRELLLDSIFAFASGLDMLADNVPPERFPAKNMFASLPKNPIFNRKSVDVFTEAGNEIIHNLKFNVHEELVIISSILPVAIAPQAVRVARSDE